MTLIITTLYEKLSFCVLAVPLIIFSIEFLIWAVLIRENVMSGDWPLYRTCLPACFSSLIITGFTFQNPGGSDFLKTATDSLGCLVLGGLIIIVYYIGTLEFPIITTKMVWIFMMANLTSQLFTCLIRSMTDQFEVQQKQLQSEVIYSLILRSKYTYAKVTEEYLS